MNERIVAVKRSVIVHGSAVPIKSETRAGYFAIE